MATSAPAPSRVTLPDVSYDRDARVDAYLEGLPAWQKAVCQQVRDLVHAADPEVAETIKRTRQPYLFLDGNISRSWPRATTSTCSSTTAASSRTWTASSPAVTATQPLVPSPSSRTSRSTAAHSRPWSLRLDRRTTRARAWRALTRLRPVSMGWSWWFLLRNWTGSWLSGHRHARVGVCGVSTACARGRTRRTGVRKAYEHIDRTTRGPARHNAHRLRRDHTVQRRGRRRRRPDCRRPGRLSPPLPGATPPPAAAASSTQSPADVLALDGAATAPSALLPSASASASAWGASGETLPSGTAAPAARRPGRPPTSSRAAA